MQMTETFRAQILAQIDQLQAQVKSARTYATLDLWGGKAFFSAIKRQKMRAIQEELTQLAHLLEQVPGLDLPQELATFDAKSGQIWDIVLDNVWTMSGQMPKSKPNSSTWTRPWSSSST